jgi:Activator of Hsp90 ATPase homolog 1-like protein
MSCVTREVTLPLGADEAWETVTELDEWLVEDADVELSPGSEGTLTLPDGSERSVVVADVEEGSRLEWWWWAEDEPATHVSLTLQPAVSGTRVVVVESGRVAGPVCLALPSLMFVPA